MAFIHPLLTIRDMILFECVMCLWVNVRVWAKMFQLFQLIQMPGALDN